MSLNKIFLHFAACLVYLLDFIISPTITVKINNTTALSAAATCLRLEVLDPSELFTVESHRFQWVWKWMIRF